MREKEIKDNGKNMERSDASKLKQKLSRLSPLTSSISVNDICEELNVSQEVREFAERLHSKFKEEIYAEKNKRRYPSDRKKHERVSDYELKNIKHNVRGLLMLADIQDGDDLSDLCPWRDAEERSEELLSILKERGAGGFFLIAARMAEYSGNFVFEASGYSKYGHSYGLGGRIVRLIFEQGGYHDDEIEKKFERNSALGIYAPEGEICDIMLGIIKELGKEDPKIWISFLHDVGDNVNISYSLSELDLYARRELNNLEKVIDFTVARITDPDRTEAYEDRDMGHFDNRLVDPLIAASIKGKLDEKFPFKPASLSSEAFREYLKATRRIGMLAFSLAETPRQFAEEIAKLEPEFAELMKVWPVGYVETFNSTLNRIKTKIAKNLSEDIRKTAGATVEGLFVDVGGTLIQKDAEEELELSIRVLDMMAKAIEAGRIVTVFTGGSPEAATEQLRQMGLDMRYLPVRSKSEFRGKVLEEVIDDALPEFHGFTTEKYMNPEKI